MYSGSFNANQSPFQSQDQTRPPFTHSQSSFAHGQPFNVTSMSSAAASHSNPSLRSSTLGSTGGLNMNDSLNQSRSHYQSGYLMSANQSNNLSQSGQRHDDAPLVPVKAKMNTLLSGSTASDFGMNSMFESSRERPRQTLADEDAPPTSSVNDIVNEVFPDSASRRKLQVSAFDSPARSIFRPQHSQAPSTPKNAPAPSSSKPLFVIVFGYPLDKYSVAVDYFRSIGESVEVAPHGEVVNCFRIGYVNPADALRAVRRNGEIVGGSWMVGVKWQDQLTAESILGPALVRSPSVLSSPESIPPQSPDVPMSVSPPPANSGSFNSEVILRSSTPNVGTPIRLAPSASAFRKPNPVGSGTKAAQKVAPGSDGIFGTPDASHQAQVNASPSKGIVGQVSDLIFGW